MIFTLVALFTFVWIFYFCDCLYVFGFCDAFRQRQYTTKSMKSLIDYILSFFPLPLSLLDQIVLGSYRRTGFLVFVQH